MTKIEIDLSDWNLGEWPDTLAREAIDVDVEDGRVRLSLDFSAKRIEDAARHIAKEAIEAFFNDPLLHLEFDRDGVTIASVATEMERHVSWSDLCCATEAENVAQQNAIVDIIRSNLVDKYEE